MFINHRVSVRSMVDRVRLDGKWSVFDTLAVVAKEGEDGVYEVLCAKGEMVVHASRLFSESFRTCMFISMHLFL